MKLHEYIELYRRGTPALTKAETLIAGLDYPQSSGWFKRNRLKDVDGEAMHAALRAWRAAEKARKAITAPRDPSTPKESKAVRKAKRVIAKALKTPGLILTVTVESPARVTAPRSAPKRRPDASDHHAYVNSSAFLESYEWKRLRVKAFEKYGRACLCCGASPATGAVLNVDHVKSRRRRPDLALDLDNLQILCGDCNHGKGNEDTDFRAA